MQTPIEIVIVPATPDSRVRRDIDECRAKRAPTRLERAIAMQVADAIWGRALQDRGRRTNTRGE